MDRARLGGIGASKITSLGLDPTPETPARASVESPDSFARSSGAVDKAPPRRGWPKILAGVLVSTLAAGVFATAMGCQSPNSSGAPLPADSQVEQSLPGHTGAADPEPHNLKVVPEGTKQVSHAPSGDVSAFPARKRKPNVEARTQVEPRTIRHAPSGDVSASPAPRR